MGARSTGSCAGAEVVLFHSVLGLRPAVLDWAARLREAGCVVHTPDLYHGLTFDDYDAGFAHVEAIGGVAELMARTVQAADGLPEEAVCAGFSNGGASAQLLAMTRPGARGALLMHAALPVQAFEMDAWPTTVPVQVHYATHDPFREQESIDALGGAARAAGAPFEAFDYERGGHLFADPGLPDFDGESADLMLARAIAFIERVTPARAR